MNAKSLMFIGLLLLALLLFNICEVKSSQSLDVTVNADKTAYMKPVSITGNVSYQGELVVDGLVGVQVNEQETPIVMRTLNLSTNPLGIFSIRIVSLLPVDEYGVFQPSVGKGNNIWISMMVKNKAFATRDVYLSITILDSRLTPLCTETSIVTIPGQEQATFMPRVYIQKWAAEGTAFILANVYDSWPRDGGRPWCPEKLSNFDIEQSSGGSLPSAPIQNGTYEVNFVLRPDMMWGTCQVNASAWSPSAGGYTGSSSVIFEYWLPGDFDKDDDVDVFDAVGLLIRYGSKEGDPIYDELYDITEPYGQISLTDAVLMLLHYGVKRPNE